MYVKGRVRVDAVVRRLTLQLEICNLMEVKLPPGAMVRLGTCSGLRLETNAHGPVLALPSMEPEVGSVDLIESVPWAKLLLLSVWCMRTKATVLKWMMFWY